MKKFDSFDDWGRAPSPEHRKLISRLRKLTAKVAPELVETNGGTVVPEQLNMQ